MRNLSIFCILSCLFFMMPAYADDQPKNPYLENMQQVFNQANAQAKAQFDKTYPKPAPPVITSNTKTMNSPALKLSPNSSTSAYSEPVIEKKPNINTPNTTTNTVPQNNASTNIAVTDNNMNKQDNKQAYNIFVPSNTSPQQGVSSQNNSAPNIYR